MVDRDFRIAWLGGVLIRAALIGLLATATPLMAAERMAVPSGQVIVPYEMLWEDHRDQGPNGEVWLVLRFLTPGIRAGDNALKFGDVAPDIDFICEEVGLPLVEMTGGGVDQVIVTLMDQAIPRGMRNAEVTQYMSAYRVSEGTCVWE